MTNVLLIIQLLVAIGLTVVILLQKSEGGALGMGGGGGGGMMSGRSAANILTRTTMVLAALFILNCIALAILTGVDANGRSVFDREVETAPAIVEEVEDEAGQIPTDG
jgi:preprotein translocase subunit SecG